MNKGWLLLEPYVYIHELCDSILIYNTINYQSFESTKKDVVSVTHQLNDVNNYYVVPLTEEQFLSLDIKLFINWLKKSFSGDYIPINISKVKPIVSVPRLCFKTRGLNSDILKSKNVNISLKELVIYISGKCQSNCELCNSFYKQFQHCKKSSNTELPFDYISDLLNATKQTSLEKISILGGDILEYKDIEKLSNYLSSTDLNVYFYLDLTMIKDIFKLSILAFPNSKIIITVDIEKLSKRNIENIKMINDLPNIEFMFIVKSEIDLNLIENNNLSSAKYTIMPYFSNLNRDFFSKFVFLSKKEILLEQRSMKDILVAMLFNFNFYGKIIIDSDKSIYTSFNRPAFISKFDTVDNLSSVLLYAIEDSSSWRILRKNVEPCQSCLYNFLCPPISDYELSSGVFHFCNCG
jgi:pseudo-rSAM protein